jgi:hypothetical protein
MSDDAPMIDFHFDSYVAHVPTIFDASVSAICNFRALNFFLPLCLS